MGLYFFIYWSSPFLALGYTRILPIFRLPVKYPVGKINGIYGPRD